VLLWPATPVALSVTLMVCDADVAASPAVVLLAEIVSVLVGVPVPVYDDLSVRPLATRRR